MSDTTPRNPLLALFASLVMPGLGQLYNGEPTKGLLLFLSLGAATPVSGWLVLMGPVSIMWLVLGLYIIIALYIYIYAIVDAYRTAKRTGNSYIPKEFNKPYIYIIVFILGYFFIFNGMLNYTRQHLVESFYIPSKSMLPSVLKGDLLFADKRVNCLGCKTQLKHGDLAILVSPNNRTTLYIKRIIGLPGDTINIMGDEINVNGVSIKRESITDFGSTELNKLLETHNAWYEKGDNNEYAVMWRKDVAQVDLSFIVPNGEVFVLGDNRNAAHDSRRFGTVPLVDVVGKARQVWFSVSQESGARWWRVGAVVDSNP